MRNNEQIKAEIAENSVLSCLFFSPAEQTCQENPIQQTLAAYVNNPLAALFKRKLSAHLSRYVPHV